MTEQPSLISVAPEDTGDGRLGDEVREKGPAETPAQEVDYQSQPLNKQRLVLLLLGLGVSI